MGIPPTQFWPVTPYTGGFHHAAPWAAMVPPPPALVYPPTLPEEKKEEKSDQKGYWKEVFPETGGEKYWQHTGTKKKTDKDPYV